MPTLTQKTNVLGYDNAYHLLRRTTYNITKARIQDFATKTPSQALDILFTFTAPTPASPLNPSGETFIPTAANPTVTDTHNTDPFTTYDRNWWLYQAMKDTSAQYKIIFWLHLLFVTDDDSTTYNSFDHKELLRYFVNGSLKDLAFKVTFDSRMLVYLSNYLNKKNSPNQNYAREFLELFTILKGPQIATGDYTNYTELDVQQAAKVFSGITISANYSSKTLRLNSLDTTTQLPKGIINITNHDTGNKTFSAAFNNTVITGGNTEATILAEIQAFMDMVFGKDETAKAYCRRMYRYFVDREITPAIESGIIEPLATQLKNNNYNFLPVLKTLLSTKHFYDEEDATQGDQVIGALVRNPMDLFFHLYTLFEVPIADYQTNASSVISLFGNMFYYISNSGLPIFQPQSVNGYAGYSSSPNFDKNFITTGSLRIRYLNTIDNLINGYTLNGFSYKLNTPNFVKNSGYFTNPSSADTLVTEFCALLFVVVPIGTRFTYFKDVFLNNLSNTNWASEWNNFINTNNATNVKIPLDRLVKALIKSPEFQAM